MRFMYETVAETAGHISFDSVDPFYDSLPWFRLIGRYVLWMLKLIMTCLFFSSAFVLVVLFQFLARHTFHFLAL